MPGNDVKWLKMAKNSKKWSKMVKTTKNGRNDRKIDFAVSNADQKVPKGTKRYQKVPKGTTRPVTR